MTRLRRLFTAEFKLEAGSVKGIQSRRQSFIGCQ